MCVSKSIFHTLHSSQMIDSFESAKLAMIAAEWFSLKEGCYSANISKCDIEICMAVNIKLNYNFLCNDILSRDELKPFDVIVSVKRLFNGNPQRIRTLRSIGEKKKKTKTSVKISFVSSVRVYSVPIHILLCVCWQKCYAQKCQIFASLCMHHLVQVIIKV